MTEERPAKARGWCRALGWRSAAIATATATTGIAVLIALGDVAPPAAHYRVRDTAEEPSAAAADPLAAELARCRTLPANSADARCRAAWEVNRRRFMGESRSLVVAVEPAPIEPALAEARAAMAGPAVPPATTER